MSRMIHNADISYSSINAGNFKQTRSDTCCRSCFLNFPYATITSTFLVISGLVISIIAIFHLLGIMDRLTKDLFYKHFPWLNELKVILLFIVCLVSVVIFVNLIIGFATSFLRFDGKPNPKMCFCSRNSTTNCLIRFVFIINQFIFIIFFMMLLTFSLLTFTLYILKTLCNSEQTGNEVEKTFDSSHTIEHSINLQPFSHLLYFKSNETQLLLFKENRLKALCRDYISTLIIYDLISFLGISLLYVGFYCYSINLTVNRVRIATYKKYTELLYLNNCTEMNAFNDVSFENSDRKYNIGVVGLPFWYGQSKIGPNQAPDLLRAKGLISKLASIQKNYVIDFGNLSFETVNIPMDQSLKSLNNPNEFNLWKMYSKSSQCIENIILNDFIPLTIGGDHSVAVGSVVGTFRATRTTNNDLSLIWIDAHADANTVHSSHSGNLHGMPVSFLIKNASEKSFREISPCLSAKNIVFIGLRDVEIQELKLLKDLNIAYFSMRDVDKFGINEVIARALDIVDPLNKNKLHISFDVDSMDQTFIPSTGTPVLGGFTLREAFTIAEYIYSTGRMAALDIVEFNPTIGTEKEVELSVNNIIEIILMFFGKSRIGYYSNKEEEK